MQKPPAEPGIDGEIESLETAKAQLVILLWQGHKRLKNLHAQQV